MEIQREKSLPAKAKENTAVDEIGHMFSAQKCKAVLLPERKDIWEALCASIMLKCNLRHIIWLA